MKKRISKARNKAVKYYSVWDETPSKPYTISVVVVNPIGFSERVYEVGANLAYLDEAYMQALKEAQQETAKDGQVRYVQVTQMVRKTVVDVIPLRERRKV
jgi:hypothetical protein